MITVFPLIIALAACQIDLPDATPAKDQNGTTVAPTSEQILSMQYSKTVMAPDACYVIDPMVQSIERGPDLVVQRTLRREPGFCAQVMTPLEVSGTVEDPGRYSRVLLEILNPAGVVLETFNLNGG